VAAAILPPDGPEDVSLRPMPMKKPSLFEQPSGEQAVEPPAPKSYIPPAPERAAVRAPRMPRIDELPMPAQNEIRAQRGEIADDHPEKRRKSLMQRLASVGLGRRDDEIDPPASPSPRTAQTMPQYERGPRPSARQPEGRPMPPVSEYARRPAPQGLDPHGRPASMHPPVHNSEEDDQLEIPAFLRRSAN
jgi:cell division protein FtsZ